MKYTYLRIISYILLGVALALGDITVREWQFWAILIAVAGIDIFSGLDA